MCGKRVMDGGQGSYVFSYKRKDVGVRMFAESVSSSVRDTGRLTEEVGCVAIDTVCGLLIVLQYFMRCVFEVLIPSPVRP